MRKILIFLIFLGVAYSQTTHDLSKVLEQWSSVTTEDFDQTDEYSLLHWTGTEFKLITFNTAYGGMHIDTNTTATAITADSTWTIVSNFETGSLDNITYSSDTLTVGIAGKYLLTWQASAAAASAGDTLRFGVAINDADPLDNAIAETRFASAYILSLSGTAILDLSASDEVSFQVMNLSGTGNVTIKWANIVLAKF